jgi:hypothetical protein
MTTFYDDETRLLLSCLARDILRKYQGNARKEFYARWLKNHGQNSLDNLRYLVSLEYQNFCGWCALHGYIAAYPMFNDYTLCNPVRVLTPDMVIAPAPPVSRPPWWSELPNLAPHFTGKVPLGSSDPLAHVPQRFYER